MRASAAITGNDEFVIAGSQAILGYLAAPAPELTESQEADVFSLKSREDAGLIDGSIGEISPFHQTFGYYAHGIAEETLVLPEGWKSRLVAFHTPSTGGATGLCVEIHDLAVGKLVAGREKDFDYVGALLRHRLVDREVLRTRLNGVAIDTARRADLHAALNRLPRETA